MAFGLKNIHNALKILQMEGRKIEELEGLLINSDDLTELLATIPEYNNGMSRDGIKLFGVKIIESLYAQKGIIFRIFKNDDKTYASSIGKNHEIPMSYFQATVPGSGSFGIDFGPIVISSGVIKISDEMKLPTVTDEKKQKEKSKKNRKHSKTRKIELD